MAKKLPFDPPSDAAILLATEREVIESQPYSKSSERADYAVDTRIADQLELPVNGPGSRWLPSQLKRLVDMGLMVRHTPDYPFLYMVTGEGEEFLESLREAGELPELPESPAHKQWRRSRAGCERKLPAFRQELQEALEEGRALARLGLAADAMKLLESGKRIERAFDRVASAVYVLSEWPEPVDFVLEATPQPSNTGNPELDECYDFANDLGLIGLKNSWDW